jgi:muconolactone delta-isomerase
MITVALPGTFTPELSSLIPPQRAYINKLMGRGIVSTYTLSADRTKLWIIMFGEDMEEIEECLSKFPMQRYMDAEIDEVMFHNNAAHYVFPMSLN